MTLKIGSFNFNCDNAIKALTVASQICLINKWDRVGLLMMNKEFLEVHF